MKSKPMQPLIFTLDVNNQPIVAFEAANLREAHEVCHEHWLLHDLKRLSVWNGSDRIRARYATDTEMANYRAAVVPAADPDEVNLVYLVPTDNAEAANG